MYYRLTYIASSNRERLGDTIYNGNKPLNIGQGASCSVLIPDSDVHEPQIFATILPTGENEGWYLVKRTDCHHVSVNGQEVTIAKCLNNGDTLSFSDGEIRAKMKFETFKDGEYDGNSGVVYKRNKPNRHYIVMTVLMGLLAIGITVYGIIFSPKSDIRHADLRQFTPSIYHVTVDSVYLLCDSVIDGENRQVVIDAIELGEVAAGTAFLATTDDDTLFVTARHCIEPWINDEEWDGVSSKAKMSPEVRLATMAETVNRFAGYDRYMLRAHCVISKGFERYDYYSTDFFMNKSRDMVLRLGTEKEVIYWRTIFPIAHRRDMELGDFAYIKASGLTCEGTEPIVKLAEWDEMVRFTMSGDHEIAVLGYPLNDNDTDDASVVYGNLMGLEFNDSVNAPDACLQLSAPINRGNSGGPVLVQMDDEIKVIGIVSKADGRATQGMFWAVPVTEVVDMHRDGDKIEVDSVTYRR